MSIRRSQNSILFLATLGVYLGLVLTGATPVLGHAATSRQFDLRDEIEFADEFDNKPEDGDALSIYALAVESIFDTAVDLHRTMPHAGSRGRYDFDAFYGLTSEGKFKGVSYSGKSVWSGKYTSPVRKLFYNFPHADERNSEPLHLAFAVDKKSFEFRLSLTQGPGVNAADLANSYTALLPTLKERELSAAARLIYESTRISWDKNQLYIVTRLARSDLEALRTGYAE